MAMRKRRKSRTTSESSGLGQCLTCMRQDCNESLITCQLCANQFHSIKCLRMLPKTVAKINKSSWSCPKCKSCEICGRKTRALRSAAENNLLLCKGCDLGFHRNCIDKEMDGFELDGDEKNWFCLECTEAEKEEDSQEDEDEEEEEDEDEDIEVDGDLEESSCDDEELEEDDQEDDDEDDENNDEDEEEEEVEGDEEEDDEEEESVKSDRPEPRLTRSKAAAERSTCKNNANQVTTNNIERVQMETEAQCDEITGSDQPKATMKPRGRRGRKRKSGLEKDRTGSLAPKRGVDGCEDENHQEEEEEEKEMHCRVPGCDSKGHLSGKYPVHYMASTCPIFHNLTWQECEERYQKRLRRREAAREATVKIATRKSPYKDDKLNFLVEQRKKELNQLVNSPNSKRNNIGSRSITSREPDLKSLSPIFDHEMFREAQSRAAELMQEQLKENPPKKSGIKVIEMGKYEMDVWYSSPYPPDYACLPKLYLCEFCLKYFNSPLTMKRHSLKCPLHCPPGNEIYLKGNISVFEIDGEKNKLYCQNLCLLAKLFLDHKTLYYDVEPFRFYIMTKSDSDGFHIIGYFSKEKNSFLNYNVSCILTLPPYQKQGYGRMLIDFSYLLTRVEGKVGSPEKPLSDLGLISYRSYWKNVILEYLCNYQGNEISIKDLSHETAINAYDIVSTLQALGMLKYWKGKHLVLTRKDILDEYRAKLKKKKNVKAIDPSCLRWEPPKPYSTK